MTDRPNGGQGVNSGSISGPADLKTLEFLWPSFPFHYTSIRCGYNAIYIDINGVINLIEEKFVQRLSNIVIRLMRELFVTIWNTPRCSLSQLVTYTVLLKAK